MFNEVAELIEPTNIYVSYNIVKKVESIDNIDKKSNIFPL